MVYRNSKMKLPFKLYHKTSECMCKTLAWFALWKGFPKGLNKLKPMKRNKNQNRRVQNELKQSLEKQYLSGKPFCHVDILNQNIENQRTSQKSETKSLVLIIF